MTEGTGTAGRIITFYSYKGGTGRTMALANVAWLLASNGYRVLTIDWDLESPGLHRYFHPFLKDKELRSSEGILDLVRKYSDATLRPQTTAQELREMARIQEYAASLAWDFPRGGHLDFVPPGRQDSGYAEAVSTFDWDSFWNRSHGGRLIDNLRDDMAALYDFVLIDSRTGTSDTAGICTMQLPDAVVNCFTLNTQSIDGAAAITNSILHRAPRDITVLPLPTRIEDNEKAKLERGRVYSRRRFEPFLGFLGNEDPNRYWNSLEVPYIPFYAYEEILAVFGDTPEQNGRLLSRYVRLASRIAGRECPAPTIADAERARVLSAFEQSTPRDRRTFVVAYAPLDRIWAEWLRDRLSGPTTHIQLHSVREPLTGLEGIDRLIMIFSRDFITRDEGLRLLRVARDRMAGRDSRFAVALRADATFVEGRMPPHALVDVMGVHEERALDVLFGALDLDPQTAPDSSAYTIRYPAVMPPHWNIKLARNQRFAGRGGVLEMIREQLLSSGPASGRLALTGLPGVGKTQIALEYAYRFAASYDVVWWISAAQPARVRVALSDLATELGLVGGDVEERVTAVLDALRRGMPERRWLVVFDNADAPGDFTELLPTGPGHVLLTSRNPQWSNHGQVIDIDVFKRTESVDLLRRRVRGIADPDADRLASRLGDLPLGLEQASGWLASTGMTVSDYLSVFHGGTVQAMGESAPPDYEETIASTVQLAYDELAKRSPAAARLLELFAFMAPEAIPYRLISNKQLTTLLAPIDKLMYDPTRHGSLNREIGRWGLARVETTGPGAGGVVVHRLTQDIIKSRLSDPQQAQRRTEIQSVLADADRGNPDEQSDWPTFEALRPHLEATGAFGSEQPAVRQLLIDMARYLWARGDYTSCVELANAVLNEWLALFGEDDTWVLRLRYALALALRDSGREEEAYAMNRDSLERLRRTLGEDDFYTLQTATSFGADLRAKGEFYEAKELDEQTAQSAAELLGDDDVLTLNAVNNLAVSLRLTGDFPRAARLDREVLERRRRVQGNQAIATIVAQTSYGVDLRERGDLEPSRNQLEEAHGDFASHYGPGYIRTLQAAQSYAVTLRRLGDWDLAAKIIDDAARRAESVLGRRHRVTLSCRLEQATLRWAEGKHDEARDAAEEIYSDYRELRGHGDPVTLWAGNDLAIFRRWAGDLEGAVRLAQKTVDRLESVLNPRHPFTLAANVTLANAHYASGSRALARQFDEAAYSRLRKALPEGHYSTLSAAVNYAISHRTEKPEEAEKVRGEALNGLQETLGARHVLTVCALDWRRIDVDTAPFAI